MTSRPGPEEPPPGRVATVGVVGAGTMGAGIAQVALERGHEVVLYDVDEAAIERGRARVADGLARRVAKQGLDDTAAAEATGQVMERLRTVESLDGLGAEADLIVEAALESLELKQTIFRTLDAATGGEVTLATNTSALSVGAIAAVCSRPDRVIGLHFFNPAPVMPLVEVVAAPASDARVVAAARDLVCDWGKSAILVRDSPGFIVNRVNRPFTLEALRMVESGEAGIEAIDRAVEAAGYPLGPFALMDLVGIDVNLATTIAVHDGFGSAARFRPSPIQQRLVNQGRLGRKAGEGFYRYDDTGRRLGPAAEFGLSASGSGAFADVVDRIRLATVNEAFRALGEELATADDIDVALVLGARHPEGPFSLAGRLGIEEVIGRLETFASRLGERFAPAPALRLAAARSVPRG